MVAHLDRATVASGPTSIGLRIDHAAAYPSIVTTSGVPNVGPGTAAEIRAGMARPRVRERAS